MSKGVIREHLERPALKWCKILNIYSSSLFFYLEKAYTVTLCKISFFLFGTIKVISKHLIGIVISNLRGTIVGVVVVCRLLKPSRDWGLGWIDIQEYHICVRLLNCIWILITLSLVILPIVPCDSNAWTGSNFNRPRKSVVVDVVHIRLYASYSARFSRHIYHF